MKKQSTRLILLGLLEAILILISSNYQYSNAAIIANHVNNHDQLKKDALVILERKCNTCHRKQNPLMVFKEKNMVKRAPKIYKVVYVDRRMPKGNEVRLTNDEYVKLKKWLFTQNVN